MYLHHRNEKYDVIEKKRGGNHFVINFCCLLVAKCSEPRQLLELPFLLVGRCSVNSCSMPGRCSAHARSMLGCVFDAKLMVGQ